MISKPLKLHECLYLIIVLALLWCFLNQESRLFAFLSFCYLKAALCRTPLNVLERQVFIENLWQELWTWSHLSWYWLFFRLQIHLIWWWINDSACRFLSLQPNYAKFEHQEDRECILWLYDLTYLQKEALIWEIWFAHRAFFPWFHPEYVWNLQKLKS